MTIINPVQQNHTLRPEIIIKTTVIVPEKINHPERQAETTTKIRKAVKAITIIVPEKVKHKDLPTETITKPKETIRLQIREAMLQDRKTMFSDHKTPERIAQTEE